MKIVSNINIHSPKTFLYFVLPLILTVIVVRGMAGEKIAIYDGAGWDGSIYRSIASEFNEKILLKYYHSYRLQRVLPYAVQNGIFNFFRIQKTNKNLMTGAQIMNFLILCTGVIFFFRIANLMYLSMPLRIIGFAAVFFIYPVLKLLGYYPFLTDTYAYTLAIMQVFYFLSEKKAKLILISIIGAFIWPTLLMSGLLLACMPRSPFTIDEKLKVHDKLILIIVKSGCILAVPILFLWMLLCKPVALKNCYHGARYLNNFMLGVSLFGVTAYIFMILLLIRISVIANIKKFVMTLKVKNIILFFLSILTVRLIMRFFSSGHIHITFNELLKQRIITPSTVNPLVFLVSNFMYYGFAVILIMTNWKQFLQTCASYGYGFFAVISLGLMMSLNSESRHLIAFTPFFIFPLLRCLSGRRGETVSFPAAILFVCASLILSQFWYTINVPGIEEAFKNPELGGMGQYQDFPAQRYFGMTGAWMSHKMYWIYLIVFIASFVVYKFLPCIEKVIYKKTHTMNL